MLLTTPSLLKLVPVCRAVVPQSIAGQRCFVLVVRQSREEAQVPCLPVEHSCVPDHVLIGSQKVKWFEVLHRDPGESGHVHNGSVTKSCPLPVSVLTTELIFLPRVSISEAYPDDASGA